MRTRIPIPTDSDFENAVIEVCREWSMKDLMEPRFLIEQATAKMKQRFPRPFKQRQVWPRVYLAVERLLASGCLRSFSVASDYSSCAYSLVIDRKDVLDIKNIDE